jgi:hypothetical protein
MGNASQAGKMQFDRVKWANNTDSNELEYRQVRKMFDKHTALDKLQLDQGGNKVCED